MLPEHDCSSAVCRESITRKSLRSLPPEFFVCFLWYMLMSLGLLLGVHSRWYLLLDLLVVSTFYGFLFTSTVCQYLNNGLPQCSPVIGRLGNFFHCRVLDCGCTSIEITPLKSCTTLAYSLSIWLIEQCFKSCIYWKIKGQLNKNTRTEEVKQRK